MSSVTKVDLHSIKNMILGENYKDLSSFLYNASSFDITYLLTNLTNQLLLKLVNIFPIIINSHTLSHVDPNRREYVFSILNDENVMKIVSKSDEDEILRLLDLLSGKNRKRIFNYLPADFVGAFKIRSKYQPGQVGRNMSMSYVILPSFWTVGKVCDYVKNSISKQEIRNKEFSKLYIVNPKLEPVGYIILSDLVSVFEDKNSLIESIMIKEIKTINASASILELKNLFNIFTISSVVVVDEYGKFSGVINSKEAIDIIENQASENVLDIGGVGEEYTEDVSLIRICFDRVKWILVAIINSILSAFVVANFKILIEEKIALAIIMPVIASLGGNVGIQTLSVVLRHLSSGISGYSIVFREVFINALNGILIGSAASIVVALTFHSFILGIIVAMSMFFNMIWSAFVGAIIPIIISKFGFNETIGSGPIITSINDIFGFAIFLTIAKIFL